MSRSFLFLKIGVISEAFKPPDKKTFLEDMLKNFVRTDGRISITAFNILARMFPTGVSFLPLTFHETEIYQTY